MLIFARPPSDPAPEFEPGLNLGSTPPRTLLRFEKRLLRMNNKGSRISGVVVAVVVAVIVEVVAVAVSGRSAVLYWW